MKVVFETVILLVLLGSFPALVYTMAHVDSIIPVFAVMACLSIVGGTATMASEYFRG